MKLTEKMAYLQGLIEGLDIDTSTKEGKVLMQMSEVLKEVVVYVDDLQSQVDERGNEDEFNLPNWERSRISYPSKAMKYDIKEVRDAE